MKIEFSTSVLYTPEWRGNRGLPDAEQIKCKLSVLDMGSLMSLVDAFSAIGLAGVVDTDKISGEKIKPILEQFGCLLPGHVKEFTGLFDTSGRALSVEDIVTYPRFLNLALELLLQLSAISSPQDDDVGNSKEPSVSGQARPAAGSDQS